MTITLEQLRNRVDKLELLIKTTLIPDMQTAADERLAMKRDLEEILALVSGAKKAGSLVVRYIPKAIIFGAGIMTAAGIGNPNVLKFVTHFFGG